MARNSNYDKFPVIRCSSREDCAVGWAEIFEQIRKSIPSGTLCVECYPGAFVEEIERAFSEGLRPSRVIQTRSLMKSAVEIDRMLERYLGDDPVFGRMNDVAVADFLDPAALARTKESLQKPAHAITLVIGTGASLVAPNPSLTVYADMARWEIQKRQRGGQIGNLGADN